jgi:GNAT superfamily N-acetyltransferase
VTCVVFRPGGPGDRSALETMLRQLSPDSSYSRFQSAVGPDPAPAVLDALLPEGLQGGTVLGWDGEALVAHGIWVRLGPTSAAEVALVVADSHQRRGLGTTLAERVVEAAGARGVRRIEMFTGSGNTAIARMVDRLGTHVEKRRDGPTVTYSFALRRGAAAA